MKFYLVSFHRLQISYEAKETDIFSGRRILSSQMSCTYDRSLLRNYQIRRRYERRLSMYLLPSRLWYAFFTPRNASVDLVASCGTNTAGLCCSGYCAAGHCRPTGLNPELDEWIGAERRQ